MTNLLEMRDITKTHLLGQVQVQALRGVSLSVQAGEFVALRGASGSGKTSLLHIMGCLDSVSSGSYVVDGQAITGADHDAHAPLRAAFFGFVFQGFHLVPVLSAVENVELPMLWHPQPSSRAKRRARALELLAAVGLENLAHRKPSALSGGQQQRVAIARALANSPRVVLADEPTANLDSESADQVLSAMTTLWRERAVTFVLATHDPRTSERATRIVHLADGHIVSDAPQTPVTSAAGTRPKNGMSTAP
jgi:ABC-type lipoprotein export system ATPase subunit